MPTLKKVYFLIGCDPEVFLRETKEEGRFRGAWGVTRGTKKNPYPLPWPANGTMQVDGFALEFNTKPAWTVNDFIVRVLRCKEVIQTVFLDCKNLEISLESTVEFDSVEWERAPWMNRQLGCDPDLSAYTLDLNPTPNQKVKFRTAAGHIHIGWGEDFQMDNDYISICGAVVKEMDATLGVASLLFDPDTKRRSLYGKAGAFRPKNYGVEYRVLSNRWIKNSKLIRYVYKLSFLAIKRMMDKELVHTDEVQSIINNDDKDRALAFLQYTNCPLPPEGERIY